MWEFLAKDVGVSYKLPGDKTPYNIMSINLIARAFPNVDMSSLHAILMMYVCPTLKWVAILILNRRHIAG